MRREFELNFGQEILRYSLLGNNPGSYRGGTLSSARTRIRSAIEILLARIPVIFA